MATTPQPPTPTVDDAAVLSTPTLDLFSSVVALQTGSHTKGITRELVKGLTVEHAKIKAWVSQMMAERLAKITELSAKIAEKEATITEKEDKITALSAKIAEQEGAYDALYGVYDRVDKMSLKASESAIDSLDELASVKKKLARAENEIKTLKAGRRKKVTEV